MDHRGVIQVQGGNVQESRNWARMAALPAWEGREMLEELKDRIGDRNYKLRKLAFEQAHEYINYAEGIGGVTPSPFPIKKSYPQPPRGDKRVDIEVHKGCAFVPGDKPGGEDHHG